jgi:hypothetical protein
MLCELLLKNIQELGVWVHIKGLAYYFGQQILAWIGVSVSVGVSGDQLRAALKLVHPEGSPAPLIRIGGSSDGGYLVPDDLEGLSACFSPGVADSASFELGMAELGIRSHMADYSIEQSPVSGDLFTFEKLFLATHDEEGAFIRLDDWINANSLPTEDLILQMDIEGDEWPILADASSEVLSRFRIIVLELHGLDTLLTDKVGLKIFETVMRKLTSHFSVVHLHENNYGRELNYSGVIIPQVIEMTLIRRDRTKVGQRVYASRIPHPLDAPNNPGGRDLGLSNDWTGNGVTRTSD